MFTNAKLFIYRALTPLHCGAAEGSGAIDLPVARERITGFPIIPAASLKGVWRDMCQSSRAAVWVKEDVLTAFGNEPDSADSGEYRFYAGCLAFTDAQLLLMPVRASKGTFVMLTCPLQLRRFYEALTLSANIIENLLVICSPTSTDQMFVETNGNGNGIFGKAGENIFLEDVELKLESLNTNCKLNELSFLPERLKSRIAVVHDDLFKWFAMNSLEVVAHNILEKETKKSNNLWYEEVVPVESVFFQLILSGPQHLAGKEPTDPPVDYQAKLLTACGGAFFQVGGHETTGRGLMQVSIFSREGRVDEDHKS